MNDCVQPTPDSTAADAVADPNSALSVLNSALVNDPDWLKKEIRDRAIPVRSTATPAEVIPWVIKAIARHKEMGTVIPINTQAYPAWKALLEDWQTFLQQLEGAKSPKQFPSSENPAKTPATPANQKLPTRPEPGQARPDLAKPLPPPGQPPATAGQTSPANDSTAASEPESIPSIKSMPPIDPFTPAEHNSHHSQNSHTSSPCAATAPAATPAAATSTPSEPTPEPEPSTPKTPAPSEPHPFDLDHEDRFDGFKTDAERLAVARTELHDHLAQRPVRIGKLHPTQQAAIFALLEEGGFSSRAVAKLLSGPPPDGLGIHISKTTVNDWRKKYKANLVKEQQRRVSEEKLRAANQILNAPGAEQAFQTAAERILKLQILTSADAPLDQLEQLVQILTTLRKQSLAERKQHHTEIK
jgi:hypothetical protein